MTCLNSHTNNNIWFRRRTCRYRSSSLTGSGLFAAQLTGNRWLRSVIAVDIRTPNWWFVCLPCRVARIPLSSPPPSAHDCIVTVLLSGDILDVRRCFWFKLTLYVIFCCGEKLVDQTVMVNVSDLKAFPIESCYIWSRIFFIYCLLLISYWTKTFFSYLFFNIIIVFIG